MATNIRCRAKNPSSCWKHGTGTTLTVKGAKLALQSAKEELARRNPGNIDEYIEHKKAIERYEQRIAYLSGGICTGFTVQEANEDYLSDLYKEKVLEAFKDSGLNKSELELLSTSPYNAIRSMTLAAQGGEYYPNFSPTELHDLDRKIDHEFLGENSREKADYTSSSDYIAAQKVENRMLAEGYIKGIPTPYTKRPYFYKSAALDPKGYDAWNKLYQKNLPALEKITKEVEVLDKEQYDTYNKAISKKSVAQKIQERFGKPRMINHWDGF